MKEKKVLSRRFLPTQLPVSFTALTYLFLDKFHAAGWIKGACWTFMGLIWIAVVVGVWYEQHSSPQELFKSESGEVQP
jgi:hypothetical protein